MTNITRIAPVVTITDGKAITTSRNVAEVFGKQHDDVLRRVRTLNCSKEFHARNFAEMVIDTAIGSGATRKDPAFAITRDGMAFLVMGFTGKRAAQFKEAYIAAFNAMEAALTGTAQTLLPAQKRQLQELVASKAKAAGNPGEAFPAIWGHLKTALQVPSYHEIPAAEFDHACELVRSFQLPAALPNPDPGADNFAKFQDAVQLAMEIMRASNGTGRVIYHAESKHIQRVQPDACVMNADGFIEAVSLGDLYLTDRQLHILSVAVGLAFAKRMEFLRQRAGLNMEQAA